MTSVTPAASAMSFWVFFSLFCRHAMYRAAAASPMGSLPAAARFRLASLSMFMAAPWVFPDMPVFSAIFDTYVSGSAMGMCTSSSRSSSL